jgi:hypothetical protein
VSRRVVHRCLAHILSAQLIDLRIKPGRCYQEIMWTGTSTGSRCMKRKQQCITIPSPDISVTVVPAYTLAPKSRGKTASARPRDQPQPHPFLGYKQARGKQSIRIFACAKHSAVVTVVITIVVVIRLTRARARSS